MATELKRVAASKKGLKSSTFDPNKVNEYTRYTLVFDEYTGENLFYEKTPSTGFYTVDTQKSQDILDKYFKDLIGIEATKNVFSQKKSFQEILQIAKPIDLYDDNLGPLIRIIFGEGFDGNDIDKRIVAESVINRFLRKKELDLTLVGKVAENLKEIIEAGNGSQYNAIKEVKKKEGNLIVYKEFNKWFEWMCQNLMWEMNRVTTKLKIVECFKVAIQIQSKFYNYVGCGVTHYYMSLDRKDKTDGEYFEKKYPSHVHLIKKERKDSLIIGYSLNLRDASKKP